MRNLTNDQVVAEHYFTYRPKQALIDEVLDTT